jgi:Zn-dependent protease
MFTDLPEIIAQILAIVFVLTTHEFAHGYVAYKFGDETAKRMGRLTLNPLKHFDPIGLLAFVLTRFGWAKPVPINPNNFKNKRQGYLWTSAAGILVNYCTAFLVYPILLWIVNRVEVSQWSTFFYTFFYYTYSCSLSFCVFNLLPLYPLDGFRIVEATDGKHQKMHLFLRRYSSAILIVLVVIHYLAQNFTFLAYVDLLGFAMQHIVKILAYPIEWLGIRFIKAII